MQPFRLTGAHLPLCWLRVWPGARPIPRPCRGAIVKMGEQDGQGLSRGKWLALAAALLGWMFEGLEQGLFPLVGRPALQDLLDRPTAEGEIARWLSVGTAAFLVGAATRGVLFDDLTDTLVAHSGWRLLFFVGAAPAVLTFFIRLFVPESERWQREQSRGSTAHWATRDLWGVLVGAGGAALIISVWALNLDW